MEKRKKLFGDTVSPNCSLFGDTVSPNYSLFGDTVIDVRYSMLYPTSMDIVSPNYSLFGDTFYSNVNTKVNVRTSQSSFDLFVGIVRIPPPLLMGRRGSRLGGWFENGRMV